MRIRLAATLLLALLTAAAPARAAPETISAIEVIGNSRTRIELIRSTIGLAVGDRWGDGAGAEVRRKLLNTRLFWEVTVDAEPGEGGVVVRVAVREKWTIIPLPVVSVTEDRTTAGISLMESNLLGSGGRLFATVMNTDGDWSAFLFYSNHGRSAGDGRFFLSGQHGDGEVETWSDGEVTGRYRAGMTGGSIGIGRTITGEVSVSATGAFVDHRFGDADGSAEPPADGQEVPLGLVLEIDRTDHEGGATDRGFRGRFWGSKDFPDLGSDYRKEVVGWRVGYSLDTWRRQTLTLASSGTWGWHVPSELHEGLDRLRGYERGRFRSDRAATATVEYIVPVAAFSQVDLSLAGFVDAALFRDRERAFTLDDAVADAGIGFRVYLKRVLLPVFQLYLAYAVEDDVFRPGLTLGFFF